MEGIRPHGCDCIREDDCVEQIEVMSSQIKKRHIGIVQEVRSSERRRIASDLVTVGILEEARERGAC